MLYNSADSSHLSEHFKFLWGFFKNPKLSMVLSTQLSQPYSSTLCFQTTFFQLCWVHFLKIMWKRIFDDLFQPMHQKKKNLFSVLRLGGEGKEKQSFDSKWKNIWIFNSTNSVVPCWSLTLSIRKKGCSVLHQLISVSITSLSAGHWQASMEFVRERCARGGEWLHHLEVKELILAGEKPSEMALHEACLHPK